MSVNCPGCLERFNRSEDRTIVKVGRFRRVSDSRFIQRYFCRFCQKHFIRANPCYNQNKRQVNFKLAELLSSGVSQRRAAKILKISRTTVARKLIFLGLEAFSLLKKTNLGLKKASVVVFDDLETFEHTKCKPLSVTLAVDEKRRILAFEVSQMAAKGKLAKIAKKKYGPRKDTRALGRKRLFKSLKPMVEEKATFRSDMNPYYPKDLKAFFPQSKHEVHKGKRGGDYRTRGAKKGRL